MPPFTTSDFANYKFVALDTAKGGRKVGINLELVKDNPVYTHLKWLSDVRKWIHPTFAPVLKGYSNKTVQYSHVDMTIKVVEGFREESYDLTFDGVHIHLANKRVKLSVKHINALKSDEVALKYLRGEITLKEANEMVNALQKVETFNLF